MKSLLSMALSGAVTAAAAQSAGPGAMPPVVEVRSASAQQVSVGSAETFTGDVRISSPFQALLPGTAGGATVTFTARARTAWHTHPLGQTLIVTEGQGLVQQQGQPALIIRPGDVVTIPPNVRHWHGAGPQGSMTHIAIAEKENGSSVAWQDKLCEQDYQAAVVSAGLSAMTGQRAQQPQKPQKPQKVVQPASDSLSPRQRAIPLIAAFTAISDMPRLGMALNQGLDAGMTVSEAKEVLVQLYAYAGFPRSLNALGELLKVVELRKQRGLQDAPGHDPSRAVSTGRELVLAGQANQTEISGGPVQGPVFEFAPIINQFLQAHLFGDIFERDNLDWRSRELATVGALAATPGAENQLRSHMRASLRVGLTASQLRQLSQALAQEVGPEVAARANDALVQVLDAASKG
ncbi:quercetin dioxygenase-like cupin family protein [Delftia sp. 60]|uniref:(R)-mandelonitrile lyase n=1 Tax=Delftia sp. 60 TaxID=2035216 RepID=UPI000C1774BD|nr:carboxymuconolactone decarboxylase family protein [Delftia sp. 60]PIF37186.1 quercetin dioxygenase-like cupin family protein [Burkholderiales bacterium 23]PIF67634.1 quercetin dioxygenase-like cupin family protein [Delftia sp. 60]